MRIADSVTPSRGSQTFAGENRRAATSGVTEVTRGCLHLSLGGQWGQAVTRTVSARGIGRSKSALGTQ